MAFYEVTSFTAPQNILYSDRSLVVKTHQAKQSDAKEDEKTHRKILKAGSLYTDETTQEIGVVYEDYDLTDYEMFDISVVEAGHLLFDKVSEEAQAKKEDFAKQGLYLHGKGAE